MATKEVGKSKLRRDASVYYCGRERGNFMNQKPCKQASKEGRVLLTVEGILS